MTPSPQGGGASPYLYLGSFDQMAVATVNRCVNIICESVASLAMQYMRISNGIYVEDRNDPLHYLVTVQPCVNMNAHDFWYGVARQLLFYGNAYIFPRYDVFGELSELVLCGSRTVAHDVMNGTYTICDTYNGVSGTFGESEIIHIMANSSDGLRAHGVVVDAWLTISTTYAGDLETKNRFVNGGNVRGFVTNDKGVTGFGQVQDEELSSLAMSLDEQFSRGAKICSLPGDSDFKQVSMSSTDMQFLESRKFQVDEICRYFGVNPSFAFASSSTNYKDAEQAYTNFLTFTLNPYLRRIETELNRKLVPRKLCCKRIFRFDRSGIYAMDQLSKADYFKKMQEIGAMTVNEIRSKENLPSVEGGDVPLVSANLKTLEALKDENMKG